MNNLSFVYFDEPIAGTQPFVMSQKAVVPHLPGQELPQGGSNHSQVFVSPMDDTSPGVGVLKEVLRKQHYH